MKHDFFPCALHRSILGLEPPDGGSRDVGNMNLVPSSKIFPPKIAAMFLFKGGTFETDCSAQG